MQNRKRPDKKPEVPTIMYPGMPNQYSGPYGTSPKNRSAAPFWYMETQKEDPTQTSALLRAFQAPNKRVQGMVNRQRHPSDKLKGY